MTLNDLERRNSHYFVFFLPNSIALQADYVTVVEDRPIMSVQYCLPVPVFHFLPKLRTLQRGFSAIAEHLVFTPYDRTRCRNSCSRQENNVFIAFARWQAGCSAT